MEIKLRDYQVDAVNAIIEHFNQDDAFKKVIVAMPTGTGKSLVIAKYIDLLNTWFKDVNVLMITHKMELITQNAMQLNRLNKKINVAIYSAALKSKDIGRITFAGIDSIVKIADKIGFIDYVLIDECHLVGDDPNSMYNKVLTEIMINNPSLKIIGFTATPWRMKGGLLTNTRWWDKIIFNLCSRHSFIKLINDGYLSKIIPYKQNIEYDVSKVKTTANDFNLKELQAVVDKNEYTVKIVNDFIQKANEKNRKRIIVFSSGLEHSKHIGEELYNHGKSYVIVDSKMSIEDRTTSIERFKAGQIDVLINYNILTTGFDCPEIDCIVVMRPTKSSVLWVQALGRGTRVAEGKTECIVLDYGANTERLGAINDPFIPTTTNKKAGKGDAPVRTCPECGAFSHISSKVCEACGYEFPVTEKLKLNTSEDDLVKEETWDIKEIKVMACYAERYESRSGKNMVRVAYNCLGQTFYDYLDVEGIPKNRHMAERKWKQISDMPLPETIDSFIVNYESLILVPTHLMVWFNTPNGYPKIMRYIRQNDVNEEVPF